MKKSTKVILLIIGVLVVDQLLKIWVKTNMEYGTEFYILGLPWARIHFVENEGMAFGWTLGFSYGKLLLSLFRIFAVGFLIYYIRVLIREKASFGLLSCFALILAGALGNIIDSAFYGMIFSDSFHGGVAELFPKGGGYSSFLHGKVVDMLYFPMIRGHFPEWFPFWSGEPFLFFRPVFNIADSAITIGVLSLLIFHRSFFSGKIGEEKQQNAAVAPVATEESTTENVEESPEEI
ncbi:MAG: lipoprotein signal peptidase [Phaeodactylibacter sp.]|nr:lipoprotein signal peptidase [Phaeodactylibacter sp.]